MVLGTGGLDGTPGEQMMQYYEERAKGGVGLIITEATRVDEKHGPLAPRQLAMSKDRHIEPFAKMVKRTFATAPSFLSAAPSRPAEPLSFGRNMASKRGNRPPLAWLLGYFL